MTTSATATPPTEPGAKTNYDPDHYRMTMGEHLEELRTRLVYALLGMVVAALLCFALGQRLINLFCAPLIHELQAKNLSTQLYYGELGEPFMVYVKISLISAAVLSAPWMLFQVWQFVAAGLYPRERKYITKYIPLSIALLISGLVFVYYIILPWTIAFFLTFGDGMSNPIINNAAIATNVPKTGLPSFPVLDGDPPHPQPGQAWFNQPEGRLKFYLSGSDVRVIPFGSSNLLAPHLSLPEYIDLVLTTLLTFGLCFQLPLVVLTLVRIGIVPIATLRTGRRYVYFGLAVLAATMTPGDVITAMVALMAPLVFLYEFGIFLAAWNVPKEEHEPVA
jgi:sec-independent protein translocase protein TatC